jgi:PRTRC genetic system protein B
MLFENVETRALLVHHHRTTHNIDVTTHPLIALADGQYTLGAGRAMTIADKEEMTAILLNEERAAEFIDESILVNSRSMICWYRKPEVREIPFEDGVKVVAPIPGLIFAVMAGQPLRCFAYKGKSRPTPSSALYYPPFGNVFDKGTFCTGNVNLPKGVSKAHIPAWENFVLNATNTHKGNVEPLKGVSTFKMLIDFYQSLAKAGAKAFPARKLSPVAVRPNHWSEPVHVTFADLIEGRL